MKNWLVCRFIFIAIWLSAISANAEIITVGSLQTQPGETVFLPITIDIPENIAGTVFTLTYNSSYFTLTDIQSTFFDTFTNQWLSLDPVPDPMPAGIVTMDGTDYVRPLLFNNITDATLIAAARVRTGANETTLFTLQFTVNAGVPDGIYPVSISATSINNTSAGYPAEGETLPILIGAIEGETNLSLAFPALSTSVVNGTIIINTIPVDLDEDGIADAWEIEHFGDTGTADDFSDYDKDGYTDLQEYLNVVAEETDPIGGLYDPKVVNAPGGTGYNPNSGDNSFWNLMLPAILGGNK